MSQSAMCIGFLLVGSLLGAACGGMDGGSRPSDPNSTPPPCGTLREACSASSYCLVSSLVRSISVAEDLILTSSCESFPPPPCQATDPAETLCACLIADAKARNSNCTRPGTLFRCDVHTREGDASPRFELTCGSNP